MAYYLRKEEKGIYLQVYNSHWDKKRNNRVPKVSWVLAMWKIYLISAEIPDPIAYYTDFVAKKNEERTATFAEEPRPHGGSCGIQPRTFSPPYTFRRTECQRSNRHSICSNAVSVSCIRHDGSTHFSQSDLSIPKIQNGFYRFSSSLQQFSDLRRPGL